MQLLSGQAAYSRRGARLATPGRRRSRRQLYEAVLGIERCGGSVAERPLALVDVVLSPSAGLVICDNSGSRLVRLSGRRAADAWASAAS